MTGKVVHFEVPFDDGDRAREFYEQAFGWQLFQMPEFDYTAVSTGPGGEDGMPSEPGYIGGGMFKRGSEVATGPVITIDVPDIDAALKNIEELGGKTASPRSQVGDMGFAAYFVDTEGNTIGLWENAKR